MKNNLTESRFQFLAGVINENESKQLNEEEASEIIPGDRDKDFQIGGIQANIPPNAAQIAAWVSNKRLTTQQAMVLFEKYGFTTWDFITAGWELGKRNFPIRNFPK